MARPLRTDFAGALHHVTSRGNERRPVLYDDTERETFLTFLGETVRRFAWRVTAYVLMTNHFHLVVQTPEAIFRAGKNGTFVLQPRSGDIEVCLLERDAAAPRLGSVSGLGPSAGALGYRDAAAPRLMSASNRRDERLGVSRGAATSNLALSREMPPLRGSVGIGFRFPALTRWATEMPPLRG